MIATSSVRSQLRGDPVDPRTDIFSLGIVLYEMSCGKSPFHADNYISIMHAILYQAMTPIPAPFPEALKAVIERSLAKDPAQRYQNVGELRQDLSRFLRSWVPGIADGESVNG